MKIFIATHAHMAEGMKSAIELLLGENKDIYAINAYTNDDSLDEQFHQAFKDVKADEQCLVFTDLYGGSVNQFMTNQLSRYHIELITGVNLAVILEFALHSQDCFNKSEIKQIIQEAQSQLRYVNEELAQQGNECDFFEEEA